MEIPLAGVIKINVDAAFLPDLATIAAVARNELGHIIKVWAKKILTSDPLTAEAFAIRWVFELAKLEC